MTEIWKELIELEAARLPSEVGYMLTASAAISLKRIADALEKQQASYRAIEPGELGVSEPDPSLKRIADALEDRGFPPESTQEVARLKARCQELQEIASREIERRRQAEAALAPNELIILTPTALGAIEHDCEQHTSVGEMADQVARHKGTMILDVDTLADGTQHAHAVATWEDADEGGRPGD